MVTDVNLVTDKSIANITNSENLYLIFILCLLLRISRLELWIFMQIYIFHVSYIFISFYIYIEIEMNTKVVYKYTKMSIEDYLLSL